MALNAKQARFVAEYLVDLNATQAAIRAGYSEKTAYSIGQENLSKPEIAAAVQAAMDKRAERTGVTQDRVVAELAKIGFADLSGVVTWGSREVSVGYDADGKRLSPQDFGDAAVVHTELVPFVDAVDSGDLSEELRGAVSEVALTKDGLRIKMHDKKGALEALGRHLGMFKDRIEHSGPDGGPIKTETTITDRDRAKAIAAVLAAAMKGA